MFKQPFPILALLSLITILLGACTSEADLPATNGSAVWSYLEDANFQEEWEIWPGKGLRYLGIEPHGMLLTTYLNSTAYDALTGDAASMPNGSILVKENYTTDGLFDSTTVMYKVQGYNAEHNDWFWMKRGADGAMQAEGKVEGCQACHGAASDNDYILTESLR